jgi:hypothetical protein
MPGAFTGWRKSSHSRALGQCVEVGNAPASVAVRDSTDRDGPVLVFGEKAWRRFAGALKG